MKYYFVVSVFSLIQLSHLFASCQMFTKYIFFPLSDMHFVKKIPTTAEQKAVMEKERSVKLKNFCQLRDKIFSKRAQCMHVIHIQLKLN